MRVMVVCGGSGGHLLPGVSFAEELTGRGHEVMVVIGKGDKAFLDNRDRPWKTTRITAAKFSGFFSFNTPLFLVKLIKAFIEAWCRLNDFKPDVAVGFGGYVSLPIILIAKLRHIPVVIHEQNVCPGKANQFLALFADRVAVSFEQTKAYFKKNQLCRVTGNILRRNIYVPRAAQLYRNFDFSEDRFTLLVFGGSQGAVVLNRTFLESVEMLSPVEREHLQVIHLSGEKDAPGLKAAYQQLNLQTRVFSFLESIEQAYAVADLVICRAGATTIAELIALQKPAIIIPYPYAGQHQDANAQVLGKINAAVVINQNNFSAQLLKDCVLSHWNNLKLQQMRERLRRVQMPIGRKLLVSLTEELGRPAAKRTG